MKHKIYLSFDEHIEHLEKNRCLKFKNNIEKNKFKWYLSNFNYQNFVNGYNDFFMINFDRNSNKYRNDVFSTDIINLFNFDRWLHSILFNDILNIETMFSTKICYFILHNYHSEIRNIKNGLILNLNNNDYLKIFPGLENKFLYVKKKDNEQLNLNKNIKELKKILYCYSKNSKVVSKYTNKKDIPIWSLSINWTFGSLIKIYSLLNKKTKKDIAASFLKNKKPFHNFYLCFENVMLLINDFRNSICHGNVIYNVNYKKNKYNIFLFYKNFIFNEYPIFKSIRLYEILKIIEFLNPHKTNIISMIKNKFLSYEINDESFREIEKYTRLLNI